MKFLDSLEDWLARLYEPTPALSAEAKAAIAGFWPVVALVFGVLQILAAIELWRLGHRIDQAAQLVNSLGIYGSVHASAHLNLFYWLSLVVLALDGFLLLLAYQPLRRYRKSGWRLLFYAALLNLLYGIFSAYNNYGGGSSFLLQLVVSAIILYFLFQIRDRYKTSHSR